MMTTSEKGINLIVSFEGVKLKSYQDVVGIWTIGCGTIKYPNGTKVKIGDTCTYSSALNFLHHDLQIFEAGINHLVTVPLTQNQFDALVSLVYNIGLGNFSSSTLLKKLNAKDYLGASDQILVWNKAGGKIVQGLINRRKTEKQLFDTK